MKWLKWICTGVKGHIIVTLLIGGLVVIGTVTSVIVLSDKTSKTSIELKDKLDFEVNSEVYLISLIKKISNGEILTENKKVDTSKIGKQKISIKYLNEKEEKSSYSFDINIVDTTPPSIEFNKELSTTIGSEIDLLGGIVVKDNSNEDIKAVIEGEYDFNKSGTYDLKYVAVDSSNNKTEENFVLKVEDIVLKRSGYYVNKEENEWNQFIFREDNSFEYDLWMCPKQACGGYAEYGTYSVSNSVIKISISYYVDYTGEKTYTNSSYEAKLVNDNEMIMNSHNFIWQNNNMFDE